jgi:hypothetical protein
MLHPVSAARPATALQATELPQQLGIVQQDYLARVQHRQQLHVDRRAVALARHVVDAVLGEGRRHDHRPSGIPISPPFHQPKHFYSASKMNSIATQTRSTK